MFRLKLDPIDVELHRIFIKVPFKNVKAREFFNRLKEEDYDDVADMLKRDKSLIYDLNNVIVFKLYSSVLKHLCTLSPNRIILN